MSSTRVSRPPVAIGDGLQGDGREVLARLRSCRQTIQLVLVALTDGAGLTRSRYRPAAEPR